MSDDNKHPSINDALSKRTSIFGLRLWVVVGIGCGAGIVVILFLISLWFTSRRNSKNKNNHPPTTHNNNNKPTIIPNISKEIQEIRIDHPVVPEKQPHAEQQQQGLTVSDPVHEDGSPIGRQRIQVDIGKGNNRILYPEKVPSVTVGAGGGGGNNNGGSSNGSGGSGDQVLAVIAAPEVSHLGWGHWYTLRELEDATNGFLDENVIGEGGYGIVYRGVLEDNSRVAVKNLLNNRGQAEREFKVEVEAIGRVRHKNLVRLLGYCAEGAHRMLVYEYVNNGNLEQWIHGDVGPYSPLTWDIRMHIALGTAKGLTYLHEGLEPKVVHRDIKSSNILLDKQWNAKVSDFGLAKLLGSERNYVTTRVMGTFGYVAPEYASTGMLNERSDVYSFGILLMELISGRNPVDYSRPPGEVNMVDWLKTMVTNRNSEGVLDPKIPEKPTSRSLKRAILVALRCVDPNSQKRPKMGHVIHMLETDDFPLRDDRRPLRDNGRNRLMEKRVSESGDSSGYESGAQPNKLLPWRKLDHNHDEEEEEQH